MSVMNASLWQADTLPIYTVELQLQGCYLISHIFQNLEYRNLDSVLAVPDVVA